MAEVPVILKWGDTGAEVVGAKIRQTTKSIRDMEEAMKRAFSTSSSDGIGRKLRDIGTGAGDANNKVSALAKGMTFLGAAITGIAIRKFVSEIVTMVDAFTNLQNKIKVVTEGHEQLAFIQHELFQMSRETRTGIDAIATVYTRTARSVKDLGKSQLETLKFTETLSKAVAVGGSTAVEASNAMIQLSQGLSSGTLRGDELRSVLEQLPVVARLIADSMGVSVGQLRALGAAGKLTSEQVFDAIIKGSDKTAASFAKLTPKVGESFGVLASKATEASGALQPFFTDVSKGLLYLADNFDSVVRTGLMFVNVIGVMLAAKAIPTAIRAIMGLNAALASNPFGLLALGVSAAVAALLPFADKLGDSADSIITLRDVWEAFKKKIIADVQPIKQGLMDMFGLTSLNLYILSLDEALIRLAKAADFMAILTNPSMMIRGLAGDPTAIAESTSNRRGMAAFLANSKGEAADRIARDFQTKQADLNARFNAFTHDQMPGAHKKGPPTPPKPISGTSFEDILRELQDGLRVQEAGQLQIRQGGGNITLPSERSGPQFLASPEDQAVAKILESSVDKLGKKQPKMTTSQIGQLEDVIRQQQGLLALKKEQEEIEKAITKSIDERLKAEIQLIEQEQKQMLNDAYANSMQDVDIENSLDPHFGTKKRIQELEEFRDTPGRAASSAALAQQEIVKLTESMNPLQQAFQNLTDTMVQGFGDAIARSIVLRENLGGLLKNLVQVIAMQAISGLISSGINAGMGALSLNSASASVANSPGVADRGLIGGRVPGFATGGFTGSSGGMTHPNEYVLNASTTSRMGVGNLNAVNAGGGMTPSVTINNNNGSHVSVDQNALSRGEVVVMIDSAIASKAPNAVAGAMSEPNSAVSKSLKRNFAVSGRNV